MVWECVSLVRLRWQERGRIINEFYITTIQGQGLRRLNSDLKSYTF
jgi:hypothetical protein